MKTNSSAAAYNVAGWIEGEWRRGTRLFVLEGLMGSGKSSLVKQLKSLLPHLQAVELDEFLTPGQPSWPESLNELAVAAVTRASLKTRMPVIVEGAIAWPTTITQLADVEAKRLYLKRMQFEDYWADAFNLTELLAEQSVRRSVRDYHAREQPWLLADLVVERLVDGETGL
jgi:energy-coupling factor transporter ATP-binding protein EcfA2